MDPAPPLSELLVLDLSRVLAGPFATMMLADLGAEVIKVERPGSGDDTRQWGPPWAGGESAYYLSVNRNKKSITLDLKTEQAREIVRELACRADVLVENWLPGTMEKWGLGYDDLCQINPGLVYCSITGYGQTGPQRGRPGYDFVIQAEGGIMSVTGPVEGPPMKVGVAIVDLTAGMFATVAILAALQERARSGRGQYIDMALLDAQVAWLANVGSNFLISGERPDRYGNAHPNIVPYETFATSDGWIAVGVGNDRQWQRLCAATEWDDLAKDDRFATNPLRVERRDDLIPILQARFKTRSSEDWVTALADAGIPCGPIRCIDQVFSDPQILSRGMLTQLSHPTAGSVQMAGSPFKLSRTQVRIHAPPPLLGEHTAEVLKQHLGFSSTDIERLRDAGVT
jgi:formyl-CoA transferase